MNAIIMLIVGVIVIASVFALVTIDSLGIGMMCQDSGGMRYDDTCYVPIPPNSAINDSRNDVIMPQIKTMMPNSMEYFYYPNPEDVEDRDVFQKFILIRLPEELGGDADDVSAFRAYSALDLTSHCYIKYWAYEERKRMEDPCWGSMYRPIDGLMIAGERPVVNNVPAALPYLDLSIDDNGSLYVEPPKWTLDENGVVGEGRNISLQQIRLGSQIIADSYGQTHSNHPKIPVDFAGQILTQINHGNNKMEALYHDFYHGDWKGLTISTRNVSALDQQHFLNLAKPDSEFWQIDDTVIRVWGSALDGRSEKPKGFQEYNAEFVLEGFKFTINGQNIELMKKSIAAVYFPENDYDDMFLISSTVK